MQKMIFIDYDKCIGCKTCETVCSLSHQGRVNPSQARISVVRYERIGINVPMMCQKCQDPVCMAVCPMKAITFDPALGTQIDNSRCIGCKICILSCPIGGVSLDPVNKKTIMCDLCEGDPQCARLCPEKAIEYVEVSLLPYKKRRDGIERLEKFLREERK